MGRLGKHGFQMGFWFLVGTPGVGFPRDLVQAGWWVWRLDRILVLC